MFVIKYLDNEMLSLLTKSKRLSFFFSGDNVHNANFVLLNSLGNLARIFLKMVNSVLT